MEIRCNGGRKFGESFDATGILEVACKSGFCRLHQNEVVIHVWNLEKINEDGKIYPVETKRYNKPK